MTREILSVTQQYINDGVQGSNRECALAKCAWDHFQSLVIVTPGRSILIEKGDNGEDIETAFVNSFPLGIWVTRFDRDKRLALPMKVEFDRELLTVKIIEGGF